MAPGAGSAGRRLKMEKCPVRCKGGWSLKAIRRYLKTTDKLYLFLCIACSLFGVLVLVSVGKYIEGGFQYNSLTGERSLGGYKDALVQAMAFGLGLVCAIVLSCIDYRALARLWPLHVAVTWGLVLLTLVLHNFQIAGFTIGYAPSNTTNYSWILMPGGISIQPTELAKISFILTLAMHLDNVRERINQPVELLKVLAHILVPVLVVHQQGDDGTAIVFAAIGCMMLFCAGLSWKYIAGGFGVLGLGLVGLVLLFPDKLKGYQLDRIIALFDPDNPDPLIQDTIRQQKRGRTAIGAGQIFGRGLFGEKHTRVIRAENDFVFSYMAECIGFVGCAIVLGALFTIAIRTLVIGLHSNGRMGMYICAGVFATIAWQIIINLGMNLMLLPVIGVTLPFFSAGGTSVLMLYLCVGLVLSVYRHERFGGRRSASL